MVECRQDTKIVTVIFRVYDNDPTASGTRKEQFWGFADPPKVEHMVKAVSGYTMGCGIVRRHRQEALFYTRR
jgi:hypothetical protein